MLDGCRADRGIVVTARFGPGYQQRHLQDRDMALSSKM